MVAPMQAAVRTRYGPPNVVRIAEVDRPIPKDHELLVRIHATTVNRTDCGFRAAKPFIVRFFTGLSRPRVTVLGSEFAGLVVATGGEVTSLPSGSRGNGHALPLSSMACASNGSGTPERASPTSRRET